MPNGEAAGAVAAAAAVASLVGEKKIEENM